MSFDMQPVTVAIADSDLDRRAGCEQFLQNEFGIMLLKDSASGAEAGKDKTFVNRSQKPRDNVSLSEAEVGRIKRLNPHVLLVYLNSFADEESTLLLALRRACPKSLMVLMTDDSVLDNQIVQALELGARGYLKYDTVQHQLANAVRKVGLGEAWVPRRLLGYILDQMLNSRLSYR